MSECNLWYTALSKSALTKWFGWEHPFVIWKFVLVSSNDKSHGTVLSFTIAFFDMIWGWHTFLTQVIGSIFWHWHQRSSRIECDQTSMLRVFLITNTWFLTIEKNVFKVDTKHVLILNIVPVNLACIFVSIIVTKCQVRFVSSGFRLFWSQIEGKNVSFQKVLINHFVKHWFDTFFGKCWVCQTNNRFEIITSENSLLLFNIAKLLINNVYLSRWFAIAWSNSHVVNVKMPL